MTGFEPATLRSQSGCATKLRYIPVRMSLSVPATLIPHRPLGAPHAGVAQWQSPSLPSWSCGFDSRHPLHLIFAGQRFGCPVSAGRFLSFFEASCPSTDHSTLLRSTAHQSSRAAAGRESATRSGADPARSGQDSSPRLCTPSVRVPGLPLSLQVGRQHGLVPKGRFCVYEIRWAATGCSSWPHNQPHVSRVSIQESELRVARPPKLPPSDSAARLHQLDRTRDACCPRWWPGRRPTTSGKVLIGQIRDYASGWSSTCPRPPRR
jgi:hypothetical protein